ncbi:MAG TPA: hypothetical protein VHD56_11840 [Tepidisphaeraceae bacterium]|nr:hypothetical protein [Tepidisphaeraceae bacterium]
MPGNFRFALPLCLLGVLCAPALAKSAKLPRLKICDNGYFVVIENRQPSV